MAMEDSLRRFGEPFEWHPEVENAERLTVHRNIVIAGMGGSHLGPWLIREYGKQPQIVIHRDYGLPQTPDGFLQDALVILSSHSGNTEETLDAGETAHQQGLNVAAISTGGKLLDFAREKNLPFIQIPDTGLQPRMATGYSMLAIAKLLQNKQLEDQIRAAGKTIDPMSSKEEGKRLAQIFSGKVPIIYSSTANMPIAYIWKIKINETGKSPAFYNVFPELCHNELCGFDVADSTRPLSQNMHGLFLDDFSDHPRVRIRMQVAADVLAERGIQTEHVALAGKNGFEKAFNAAILSDWTTYELAKSYGVPDEPVPLVEDFKKRIG
jgi:glucose/mannose-6-phosphate isomerase